VGHDAATCRKDVRDGNEFDKAEHPTSNVEHPIAQACVRRGFYWMLDVERWMFCLSTTVIREPPLALPARRT
jgi:hypothetical protein